MKSFNVSLLTLQIFPGLLPYKRPAPDNKPTGMVYHQPTAAAYQQLIQLQSAQQSYVPVSCEYDRYSSSDHASANNTIYPLNTSTATSNANNLHHHPNLLYSQTSINACTLNNNLNNYQLITPSNNNNNNNEVRKIHENNQNSYYHLNTTTTNPAPTNSNNFNNSHLNMNNYLENHASNKNNNPITSTFFADADAQINTTQSTAQQNSIIQSSPSKSIISSTIIDNNMLSKNAAVPNANATSSSDHDGGDASENALTVQNAKSLNVANGHDVSSVAEQTLSDENNKNKSINDMPNGTDLVNNNNNSGQVDLALTASTTTSVQSTIDESNLNAISFNSATSSSPAASMSAIYTTSSITINNNNSILSRKNSLTTPNQQLINSSSNIISGSKAPSSIANNKVDSVPDYINASSLNNPAQAALFSAVLSPYQQFALTPNLYSDPAQLAKEMAQKNYANALKFAVAQNSQAAAAAAAVNGKATPQLNALSPYSTVALPAANNTAAAMLQPGTSTTTPRLPAPMNPSTRAAYLPAAALTRPIQNPFQQFIRPQLQINPLSAAAQNQVNQYYAAAAAAQQQFLNQQNFFYPGLTSPIASPHMAVTSGTSTPTHSPFVSTSSSYPFAFGQAPGMPATHMMQVPQITSQPSQTGSTSAVVLNPYKKMKTS